MKGRSRPQVSVASTGMHQEVRDRVHGAPVDPGRGKHLWTIVAVFVVAEPSTLAERGGVVHMDRENLATIEGPGCHKCEKAWTPDVARRFCHGTM